MFSLWGTINVVYWCKYGQHRAGQACHPTGNIWWSVVPSLTDALSTSLIIIPYVGRRLHVVIWVGEGIDRREPNLKSRTFPVTTPTTALPYERGLGASLVPLCHACFLPSLREGLRLDVRLVFLCHACFLPSREELGLDVRVVCLCYDMPLHRTAYSSRN